MCFEHICTMYTFSAFLKTLKTLNVSNVTLPSYLATVNWLHDSKLLLFSVRRSRQKVLHFTCQKVKEGRGQVIRQVVYERIFVCMYSRNIEMQESIELTLELVYEV